MGWPVSVSLLSRSSVRLDGRHAGLRCDDSPLLSAVLGFRVPGTPAFLGS